MDAAFLQLPPERVRNNPPWSGERAPHQVPQMSQSPLLSVTAPLIGGVLTHDDHPAAVACADGAGVTVEVTPASRAGWGVSPGGAGTSRGPGRWRLRSLRCRRRSGRPA